MTITNILFALTLVSALGCGLIAGSFFAFSSFVMKALGKLQSNVGLAAMQSINIVVINPLFLGVFVGTAMTCVVAAILALVRWSDAGSSYILAGALLYFVGTFLVTMAFNVPLNNALAAANPTSSEGTTVWATYLSSWTMWNHVRTVAALIALLTFIIGLILRGFPVVDNK